MDVFRQESERDEMDRANVYFSADETVQAEMRAAAAGPAGSLATWEFIEANDLEQADSQL